MFTLEQTVRLRPFLPSTADRQRFFALRDKRDAALRWMQGNQRAMDNRLAFCTRIVRRQIEAIQRDIGA